MSAKRVFLGILALVVFMIFLMQVGRFDTVMSVVHKVLPEQPQVEPTVKAPEPVAKDLVDAGLADGSTGLLKPNQAVVALDAVHATPRGEEPNYKRTLFGASWSDVDRNGCDTRNDILARDLTAVTLKPGSTCVVIAGSLADPYTGSTITFAKSKASAVQIDHIVALSWAYMNGAAHWAPEERLAFANDPANLIAVSGSANMSKSDKGPADWRPDNAEYRCEYVTRFVHVLSSYKLTIDDRDRQAARRTLADCS